MGVITILILRVGIPLFIFRWPLWGGLAALVLDAQDQHIINWLGVGSVGALDSLFSFHYEEIDKLLDLFYLSIEFLISLSWKDKLTRTVSGFLFFWRFLGVILFELTGIRSLLVVFPNIFENFFLFFLIIQRYFPKIKITSKNLPLILILLGTPKIAQEYLLHISGDFSFYNRIKDNLLKFLKYAIF